VLRTDYIIVGMASIGFIGLLLDQIIRQLGRRLLPWSRGMDR
jgi:ABC-type nitrate/sulfonate/bicarbonate transport system permease component